MSSDEEDVRHLSVDPSEAVESQCRVCAEDHRHDEYPTVPITSACTHPTTDVCKECMRTYISSELSNRNNLAVAAMSCPICQEKMSYFDVKRNAAPGDFDRYDQRIAMESLQNEPGFRWCPQRGCPGGQIQAYGDAEPIVTCNNCRQRFCFTHRVLWHVGLTCSEYDELPELVRQMRVEAAEEEDADRRVIAAAEIDGSPSASQEEETIRELQGASATAQENREQRKKSKEKEEEKMSEAYVQSMAKRCPDCNSPTERNGGCKHMTCKFVHSFHTLHMSRKKKKILAGHDSSFLFFSSFSLSSFSFSLSPSLFLWYNHTPNFSLHPLTIIRIQSSNRHQMRLRMVLGMRENMGFGTLEYESLSPTTVSNKRYR